MSNANSISKVNPPRRDFTGQVFTRLTVLSFSGRDKHGFTLWNCVCSCGTEKVVSGNSLQKENTRSCGCVKREALAARNFRHGYSGTPEYVIWVAMRGRTLNPNNKCYHLYHDRKPAEEFDDYTKFLEEVGPRPEGSLSLDRIDNDKGYIPGNLRWTTMKVQANNTKTNRIVICTESGTQMTITQAFRRSGLLKGKVYQRLGRGWTMERATDGLYTEDI